MRRISLLTPGSLLPEPSRLLKPVAYIRVRSPVTVAGPRRTYTGFLTPVALNEPSIAEPRTPVNVLSTSLNLKAAS